MLSYIYKIYVTTRKDSCGSGGYDVSFSNAEEKYTTTLSNQVNEKLKEDKRDNYGALFYPTENVTTTKEKK